MHTPSQTTTGAATRRGRAAIAITLFAVVVSIAIGAAITQPALPLTVIIAAIHAAAVYGAAHRLRWTNAMRFVALGASVAGIAGAFVASTPYWAAPIAVVSLIGWFTSRALFRYLRPAAPMPAGVLAAIEAQVTVSSDAVAGMRIGARNDGAVIAFGYQRIGSGELRSERGVQRHLQDVAAVRDILSRSGVANPTFVCVVDRVGVREMIDDSWFVDAANITTAVRSATAPNAEDVLAAAEAAGVVLTRAQRRALDGAVAANTATRTPGKSGQGGKKVVHKGRVTRVEP